jgi:hypothetical protein
VLGVGLEFLVLSLGFRSYGYGFFGLELGL